ncbi:hypothetical protein [Embleya sp. NBC_00896]|uniref:hypothetical protein n=1 Tax=Embleya sp. NBC_00896 TaxID=2975961 RepID=UPI003864B53D|nr:hypothetical protein OG928_07710 [Embleya sp. NBC_00896]
MDTSFWDLLPKHTRTAVDECVLSDNTFKAVRVLWDAVRAAPEGQYAKRPGLGDVQGVVAERARALADRIGRRPEPPRDVDSLAADIRSHPGRPVAIEAIWDGDTRGWFVVLLAVHDDPPADHHLATIRLGGDLRIFNGQVPPWPEATQAGASGRALAELFDIPFHFASPDTPDDEAPRWRDTR